MVYYAKFYINEDDQKCPAIGNNGIYLRGTALIKKSFQLLVSASLVLADLETSRQVGVSPVLFFSISSLVFSFSEEIYSL